MRIIGGKFKRMRIDYPATRATRPVTDRARETIFDILGESVRAANVLDLFAGSGSLGFEALSRGASAVHFVENGETACRTIYANVRKLGVEKQAFVHRATVERTLKRFKNSGQKFSLIFTDPPHNKGLVKKVLNLLDVSDTVTPSAILVVGRSNREALPADLSSLTHARDVKVGQTYVSFLVRVDERPQTTSAEHNP